MKTPRFIAALLVLAVPASAQLISPTDYQLEDYNPWLGRLDPAQNYIAPGLQIPASTPIRMYGIRRWTTWEPIDSFFFPGDWIHGSPMQTEIVFIGQTGENWGRFGYRIAGKTVVLSESDSDRQFGSNLSTVFYAPALPDFFVETRDGTPYKEAYPSALLYFGKRQPISSVHDEHPCERLYTMNPYYVFALELPAADSETAPSLFVFGVNAFDQNNPPIPEPSTYGFAGTAALLALIAARRRRTARKSFATT